MINHEYAFNVNTAKLKCVPVTESTNSIGKGMNCSHTQINRLHLFSNTQYMYMFVNNNYMRNKCM